MWESEPRRLAEERPPDNEDQKSNWHTRLGLGASIFGYLASTPAPTTLAFVFRITPMPFRPALIDDLQPARRSCRAIDLVERKSSAPRAGKRGRGGSITNHQATDPPSHRLGPAEEACGLILTSSASKILQKFMTPPAEVGNNRASGSSGRPCSKLSVTGAEGVGISVRFWGSNALSGPCPSCVCRCVCGHWFCRARATLSHCWSQPRANYPATTQLYSGRALSARVRNMAEL